MSRNAKREFDEYKDAEQLERDGIRWLMVFYDSILYGICWLVFFMIYSFLGRAVLFSKLVFYILIGYVFFFGFRFLFRCYKLIWRYGSLPSLSRELLASVSASFCLILTGFLLPKMFDFSKVSVIFLITFAPIYIVVSVVARVFYSYLYRFAEKDFWLSRIAKRLLQFFILVDFKSEKPGAVLPFAAEANRHEPSPINELQNITDHFLLSGEVQNIKQINKGYINRTYRVQTLAEDGSVHQYILQRINTNVFPDVEALMQNFKQTTDHLHKRFVLPGKSKKGAVPTIRTTKDGKLYLRVDSGCWRMLTYFDHVYSMDIPDSEETFYYAGKAFGSFMKEMESLDVSVIKDVIPDFHNTVSRYRDLEEAIQKDPKGRVKNVVPEIEFVRARSQRFGIISKALENGEIPKRICHNDCNMNNILFDEESHLPVAIIDLDTVMASSPLYDFGDSMRIGTNTAKDDEKDLSKVSCNLKLFEEYAKGYLESCGHMLTSEELALLPYAALVITAEDGIRFLMDHINGDSYYHIYYTGQNLDRARTQLTLLADMEKKLPEIKKILKKIYQKLDLKWNGFVEV